MPPLPRFRLPADFRQSRGKLLAVQIILENVLAPIPAIEDVVNRPRILHAQFAWHRISRSSASKSVNSEDRHLLDTCSYVDNSLLVSQIAFTNSGVQRMVTTRSYDNLNRLTTIQNSVSGSNVTSSSYAYNSANQRTSVTNADNSFWVYQCDSLGQVNSGGKSAAE